MISRQLKSSIRIGLIVLASFLLGPGATGSSWNHNDGYHSSTPVPLRPDDAIIYDNGRPTDFHDALEICAWILADDFFVGSDTSLTGVVFWDLEGSGAYQGQIAWALYSDAGGYPGAVLATGAAIGSQVTRTFIQGGIAGMFDEYSNSFSISPAVAITAGTRYWLGLHNGPFTFTTNADFFWENTEVNHTTFYSENDHVPFFDNDWSEYFGGQQAFYLTGTTSPLSLQRVVSTRNGWDIPLSGDGSGIEDRSGGPNNDLELHFRFNGTLASVGDATTSCGSVVSVKVDPDDASLADVNLTGVDCNASVITVTVTDLVDTDGNTLGSAASTFGLLIGDVNGNATVDRDDYDIVLRHQGQATNSHNFRADVSAKDSGIGHIDVSDARLVRHEDGTGL
jgi:hypothetical protein